MRPPTQGTILITGASSGIGRAFARRLAAECRRLILVARRRELLDDLADELRQAHAALEVEVQPCDLTDLASVETLIDTVLEQGPLDVLINNAGVGDRRFFERAPWDKIERLLTLNVVAMAYLVRRALPGMLERGRGGILNVGSVLGETPLPTTAAYNGSKYFVAGFSETLRSEVAHAGIVVTEVRPGPVDTGFEDASDNDTGVAAPRLLSISAQQCAHEALRGFARGQPVVLPGRTSRWLTRVLRFVPAFVRRWLFARWATKLRS